MKTVMYRTGRTPMIVKIAVGFFLGMLFGFVAAPMRHYSLILNDYVMPLLELAGILFLRLFMIIILPLVFSSLVTGVASIGDTRKLGRIAVKTIILFLLTTVIAAATGMLCADVIKPGSSIDIPTDIDEYSSTSTSINTLMNIIPNNPIVSAIHANVLYIIIFALLTGTGCIFLGNTGKKITAFFEKFTKVMYRVTQIVMSFAPLGIFALSAAAAADFGLHIITPFAKIIGAVYMGCFLHAGVVYSLMIILFCKRSPIWFFSGIYEAGITAFVTRSSSITLPMTLESVHKNLGVSEEVGSFVLPLGAPTNMDGTAIYQAICAMFVARAFDVPITTSLQVNIFFAVVIASIGTVGIPSAGMIMLTMVLSSAGLPVEGVGLLAGIDVVLGAARTCLNVVGDAAVCVVVSASEGEHLTENNPRGRMHPVNYGA